MYIHIHIYVCLYNMNIYAKFITPQEFESEMMELDDLVGEIPDEFADPITTEVCMCVYMCMCMYVFMCVQR